jgi:hypothetical protein
MPAHGIADQIAHEMAFSGAEAPRYAHFSRNSFQKVAPGVAGHSRASNFLSCDARHFGLAFWMDRALQIANEA